MFVVFDVFLLISVAALAIAQASQVARNVTTNELANWHRRVAAWAAGSLLDIWTVVVWWPVHPA
jgi:predicted acyltransferase